MTYLRVLAISGEKQIASTNKEIDKMSYEPYGFTEEEIKIVEVEQDGFSTNALMAIKADEKRREHKYAERPNRSG